VARILLTQEKDVELYLHDPAASEELLLYLLRHDSTYGRLDAWSSGPNVQVVTDRTLAEAVRQAGGGDGAIDFIVDSRSDAAANGDQSVEGLLTESITPMIVTRAHPSAVLWIEGVTDPARLEGAPLISTATCDVVALAPVLAHLSEQYEVRSGSILTLHPWLSNQQLVDSVDGGDAVAFELHRAAPGNLIPKETSAIAHLNQLVPRLRGRLNGFSYRVPTPVVTAAVVTLHCNDLNGRISPHETLLELASGSDSITASSEPLVSSDILGDESMCVIDLRRVRTAADEAIIVPLWYDNEIGYAAHLYRLLGRLGGR
jgi:glyceraldehyde 3-phosphate dehydrogenase